MTEARTRTLTLSDGRVTSIRFDLPTWRAIDLMARFEGRKWADWAAELLASRPNAENMRAVLREEVTKWLLENSIANTLQDRAEALTSVPPLLEWAATLSDEQLEEEQAAGSIEGATDDLCGFRVEVGSDSDGRAVIWIRNGMRDAPHLAIALPLTVEEVAERVGARR